jgi:hypothetical protein
VFEKLVDKMVDMGGAIRGYELISKNKYYPFDTSRCENDLQITIWDPEVLKLAADEVMEENGVDVYYYTLVTDVLMEDKRVTGVVIENKSGRQIILSKRIVDGTGDASVARFAGVETVSTNESAPGKKGPMTLMFRVGGVKNVVPSYKPNVVEIPYGAVNFFPLLREGEFRVEMTRFSGDGVSAADFTEGTIKCRKQVNEVLGYLKEHWTGFEEAYLIDSAPVIGALVYPKLVGEYATTQQDVFDLKIPEDRVAITAYGIDVHSSEEGGQNYLHYLKPGDYYGLSYRILVPKTRVENILVVGKAVSTAEGAESTSFCSAVCMAMGEAAGTACALSIHDDVTPRDVDVKKLQETLMAHGAILEPEPVPYVEKYYVYPKK